MRGQNDAMFKSKKGSKEPPTTPVKTGASASEYAECKVCKIDNDEDNVICDSCDEVFHLMCVGMQGLPTGDWHCESCLSDETASSTSVSGTNKRKRKLSVTSKGKQTAVRPVSKKQRLQQKKQQQVIPGADQENQGTLEVEKGNEASAAASASSSAPAVASASASASASVVLAAAAPGTRLADCFYCDEHPGTVFTNCGHSVGCTTCNIAPKRCPTCRSNIHFTHSIEDSLKDGCLPKCWMCPNQVNVMLRPCNCLIICKDCLDDKQIKCCPRHGGDTFGRVELFTN